MTDTDPPVVAIVEDEPAVAESYELWLADDYEIVRAHDGAEALDVIDESIDVVLLDRMMPEHSGEEVLQEIRARGIDCRVAMVTAVEPDFDVVEMGFDAYITKPPERSNLLDTVETLLDRASVDDEFQEYHSLMARRGALEAEKSEAELADSDEYQDLLDRIDAKQTAVDDGLGDMGSEIDFVSAVRDLSDDASAHAEDVDGAEWDGNEENA
ncbi:response regulator with CheY-like receiver domain and winged-helix DNA-binding domain [Halovivax ruber XH-70]|uniref:Response regulator with CheY-like receiver domain and winged-helix DNA-binding domain n=1 Tax=Halovivax ruber (strain DSM 18193 / JCM 13892 / XH-70) TaxID=797302 RepID=L0I9A1_HALRX|nr:HalX domain-containing protein [Halovivax ruber]AGB14791.1 response regulator with CheY-like receiver domain and winged-helix DNA-binding domain [Halovivax ruber XH-70]